MTIDQLAKIFGIPTWRIIPGDAHRFNVSPEAPLTPEILLALVEARIQTLDADGHGGYDLFFKS